jgi:hypothetical protein
LSSNIEHNLTLATMKVVIDLLARVKISLASLHLVLPPHDVVVEPHHVVPADQGAHNEH